MATALQKLAKVEFLAQVWAEMFASTSKSRRASYGVDNVTLNDFEKNKDTLITRISQELRRNKFSFSSLKPRLIPKANGKFRVICIPTVTDRLVQRALYTILCEYGQAFQTPGSYGFVKGADKGLKKGVAQAVSYRAHHPWAYKTDITSFFDQIPREQLIAVIRRKVRTRSLHSLLESAVRMELLCYGDVRSRVKKSGIVEGRGVRQGTPLAPYFSNLILYDFDILAHRRGLRIVRYADDLIFFCSDFGECKSVHEFCVVQLGKLGLSVPSLEAESKTMIADPSKPVEFLGLELSKAGQRYVLVLSKERLNKLKETILENSDINYLIKANVTVSKLLRRFDSLINGYLGAYDEDMCHNHSQLLDVLNSARNLAMQRLFEGLHLDIKSMTTKQKRFLEIA